MLTATYTLVALSVEQTSIRVELQSLRQMLQSDYLDQPGLTAAQVEYAAGSMQRLYDACHWRKLDKFLVPALRRATCLADDLLAELAALSKQSADALAVSTAFGGALDDSAQVAAFCRVVTTFCNVLLMRLEREERDLFPLARSAVAGEAWFALANQMLAHDAYLQEHRCEPVPARNTHPALRARREKGIRPPVRLSTLH